MKSFTCRKVYKTRIKKLCKDLSKNNLDAILVSKPSNIFYLSGLDIDNCFLLISTNDRCYVFTDSRFRNELSCLEGNFKVIITDDLVFKYIAQVCQKVNIKKLAIESNSLSVGRFRKLTKSLESVKILPKEDMVENLRIIKEAGEIDKIKKAIGILSKIYKKLNELIDKDITEWELAYRLEYIIKRDFKTYFSFNPIITSGKNSCYPHAKLSNQLISRSRYILVDIGVKFMGYSCDLTRMYVLSKMTREQEKVYNLLLTHQKELLNLIKPGIELSEIDRFSRSKLSEAGFSNNIMHSVGHGVGIDVHEYPCISFNSKHIARPGMVFALEPGLYFPKRWGMRIEDMVLMTDSGCQVLTDSIAR